MLVHMTSRLKEAGIEFYITRAKHKVEEVLKRSGLYEKIGGDTHFFGRRTHAVMYQPKVKKNMPNTKKATSGQINAKLPALASSP